ncbi:MULTISPECIES: hypothetical protein [unclassified Streptomyces]|uniref:hypothetical protein n=1 Tax=Streptomyces TaxID=1883 RepID=UPI000BC5A282|nr:MULTISPECIES: hypothetical protein [unclassified Streptomyces]MDN3251011.1 hypothetical protein [Streptomyces sp. ZSW22]MDN3258171.1 hypothetical protein [Streptomyces sp. MA25(2023)]PAK24301.1 hypothetical protein CJD44_23510 [Streptomyces sp. alain-838]
MGETAKKTADSKQRLVSTSKAEPKWREARWEWRRPGLFEVTSMASVVPVGAMMGGYLDEGPAMKITAGVPVLNAVIGLAKNS